MTDFVAYFRVSTQGQGRSGLGLAAQRESVYAHVQRVSGTIRAEFTDIESGRSADRPQLQAALRLCGATRAILVIAKLDRLSRNVHFVSQLMESRVEFVAADMPTANKLTLHIIAAMAEYERDMISQRTRAALSAAKARGVQLGNPKLSDTKHKAIAQLKIGADRHAKKLDSVLEHLRLTGIDTYYGLAKGLDRLGIKTRRGGRWNATGVRNIINRLRRMSDDLISSA